MNVPDRCHHCKREITLEEATLWPRIGVMFCSEECAWAWGSNLNAARVAYDDFRRREAENRWDHHDEEPRGLSEDQQHRSRARG